MCGRTACTLKKSTLIKACAYKTKEGKKSGPTWLDLNKGGQYCPSYNIAPGSYTPVLVTRDGITSDPSEEPVERVLCPMRWGLVPSWHRGPIQDFELKTNNCRVEGITQKPTYRGPLQRGRRCVVLAEGFFEWHVEKAGKKQPYFVYFPQPDSISMEDRTWENNDDLCNMEGDWTGPYLLTMAGLYDICQNEKVDLYSYTVITVPSSPKFSWLHSRMPAILSGSDAIDKWLDYENIPSSEAVKLLEPVNNIAWHPVSTFVNNSRNNTVDCVLPLKIEKQQKPPTKETFLTNWLKGSPVSSQKVKLERSSSPVSSQKVKLEKSSSPDFSAKRMKK